MSTAEPAAESGFSVEIAELSRRVSRAREAGADEALVEVLVQELETAVDELRVADEEVRSQQAEVARLLEDQQLMRWRHERMLSALPVPVLTTDSTGRLRSLNAAGAVLFGLRLDHVLRKPVFTFVVPADRPAMRTALNEAVRSGTTQRQSGRLRLRDHTVPVTAYVAPAPPSERAPDDVTWLLLGKPEASPQEPDVDGGTPVAEALLALFGLSGQGCGLRDIVQRSAYVVAEALGPGAEVSVLLGRPDQPSDLSSTSQEAQEVDRWQLESGQGPCATAYRSGEVVVTPSMWDDVRWTAPEAGPASPRLTSAVVVPLSRADQLHGVLAVYLESDQEPPARTIETAQLLAAAVTSVLQELGLRSHIEELAEDMKAALASRATIEQAKGVVMAAKHCTADEAFRHLVVLSNTGHLKLREVAAQVVSSAGG